MTGLSAGASTARRSRRRSAWCPTPSRRPSTRCAIGYGTNATAVEVIEAFVAADGFVGADARRARQALLAEVEAYAGDRADNASLAEFTGEEQYGGDLFGDLPRGGYRSVVEVLAAGLDITFDAEAIEVRVEADGIRVTCADGSVEIGSHVIVTVPLGVLKRGCPRFDPPLPSPLQVAVGALGFGRYEKIALRFESAFWRAAGISHLMVFPPDETEPALWVFDLDAFGAGPVLCAHLFHSLTPYALDRSSVEAVTWFREVLAEVVGNPMPEPIATVVTCVGARSVRLRCVHALPARHRPIDA